LLEKNPLVMEWNPRPQIWSTFDALSVRICN